MKPIKDIAELRSIQLDILKHVDTFCKDNGIKYFLSGGSMIGAVRHHGYIPWDDDIDLMLLREDYDRLISLYTEKDNSEYKLHYFKLEKDYCKSFVKIDNSKTVLVEDTEVPIAEMGVNIDLFPMDVIPNEVSKQRWMYRRFEFYKALIDLKNVRKSNKRSDIKNFILSLSHFLLRPLPMRTLINALERNATKYKGEVTDYCGVAVWGYGMREVNNRRNWDEVLEVVFEDTKTPIPAGYDNYLTCVYGDYMQLPPEEKRVSEHIFKAWWK